MSGIVILTLLGALLTAIVTLIWWKVGDQWADDEYKKFGHGGGAPKGPPPEVIKDFNAISGTQRSDPERDIGPPMNPTGKAAKTDDTDQTGPDQTLPNKTGKDA